MSWDWEDTFKGLIASGLAFIGAYLFKKGKPLFFAAKKFANVVDIADKSDIEIFIINSRQRAIFHTDKVPIFIVDMNGDLIYVNSAWLDITGFRDANDAYGLGWMQAIPDEDIPEIERQNKRLKEHPSSFKGVVRFKNIITGEIVKTLCKSEVVYGKDKKPFERIGRLYILP